MDAPRRIAIAQPTLSGNEMKYVQQCLESGWISSLGTFVRAFEDQFAAFVGARYGVACTSGTTALHLALLAHDVQPGDEIIVPTLTFVATANAVTYCGAKPVFVDAEPRTMNMDIAQVEAAITGRTRGIIAVHLYGHPTDMQAINEIAARHRLFVIEDAAEAHGAHCHGLPVGSLASIGTFSFYGNKVITTGEGGMLTTNDLELAQRARLFCGQGMDPNRRYWFPVIGYNYRMTNVQAAIGLAQFEKIEEHLAARRRVADCYHEYLRPLERFLLLPVEEDWARHVFWMYTVVLRPEGHVSRDALMERLSAKGIETRPVFHPLHTLPPYRDGQQPLPVSEFLGSHGISLPTHGSLSEDDVKYVCTALGEALQSGARSEAA